jgi:hypothetical protein
VVLTPESVLNNSLVLMFLRTEDDSIIRRMKENCLLSLLGAYKRKEERRKNYNEIAGERDKEI